MKCVINIMSLVLQIAPSERERERERVEGRRKGRKHKIIVLLRILNAMITFSKCLFKIPIPLEFALSQLQGMLLDTDNILKIGYFSPLTPHHINNQIPSHVWTSLNQGNFLAFV